MTWPTECPKCGEAAMAYKQFHLVYCDGLSRASNVCAYGGWTTGEEHLHHICMNCAYEITTPCKDAGEEPAK